MAVSRYVTLRAIKHSGNDFAAGIPIALSDEYAAPLLAIGAIQAQAGALPTMPTVPGAVVREAVDTGSGGKARTYVEAVLSDQRNVFSDRSPLDSAMSGYARTGIVPMRPVDYLDGITMPLNGGGSASIALDDAITIDGESTLKVTTGGSATTITVVLDLSSYGEYIKAGGLKNMGVSFRIRNAAKLSYINVDLGTASNFANAFTNTACIQAPTVDGLYCVPLYDEDWTVKIGSPAAGDLTHLKFTILCLAANSTAPSVEINIGRPVIFGPRKSRLLLSYDDGHFSCMEIADLMEKRGLRGTFYVYTDGIGTNGVLTLAQCRELDARGHMIGVHSKTHESAQTLGDKQYYANQLAARQWILDNIGPRGANHTAFVGGHSTPALIRMMESAGFVSGRAAASAGYGFQHPGFGGDARNLRENTRWRVQTYEFNNTNTAAYLIGRTDLGIQYGMDVSLYGHQVYDAAGSSAYSRLPGDTYSLPDVYDALKARIDAGLMVNQTVNEYWSDQIGLVPSTTGNRARA